MHGGVAGFDGVPDVGFQAHLVEAVDFLKNQLEEDVVGRVFITARCGQSIRISCLVSGIVAMWCPGTLDHFLSELGALKCGGATGPGKEVMRMAKRCVRRTVRTTKKPGPKPVRVKPHKRSKPSKVNC